MNEQDKDLVIPIVREEVHAEAVPVATGGVRVTKRVESHDEIVEQELRKSNVEVKRVQTNRVVDGPQPVQRVGSTLIVPVVSEVLRVEKQWVVTEEIHITETQESQTVQNKVTLNREEAEITRLDRSGKSSAPIHETVEASNESSKPVGILPRPGILNDDSTKAASKKRPLTRPRGILKGRGTETD
jgi:stress response protein YsnF